MNINDLLTEAQFSKPIYAYHATDSANLKSILKHGMIPNHREDGYGSTETSSFGYSLAPHAGIYFTRNEKDVIFIAKSLEVAKAAMVVVCKIQERDAEVDEDRLTSNLIQEVNLKHRLRKLLANDKSLLEPGEKSDQFVNKIAETETENVIDTMNINNASFIQNVKPYIFNYIKALVEFYIATEYDDTFDDTELRQHQAILVKKLKRYVSHNKDQNESFKIDKKISFSGASKIVGIFLMNNGSNGVSWGDVGKLTDRSYHTYKSPMQLLDSR